MPRLGISGQSVINEQLVGDVDIVIAIFDSRLGMAGTAEEIQRLHEVGNCSVATTTLAQHYRT